MLCKTLRFVLCVSVFAHASASPNLAKLPLRFEPARNPIEHGRGGHVQFVARGSGYRLYLTDSGAILGTRSATIRMQMAGGNPSPKIAPEGLLPGTTNYLVGNDPSGWRTGVAGFSHVKYRDIYRGIDLLYYGNQQQLEYDSTTSSDFPLVAPFQATPPNPQVAFVTKINAAGSALVYSTYLGGSATPESSEFCGASLALPLRKSYALQILVRRGVSHVAKRDCHGNWVAGVQGVDADAQAPSRLCQRGGLDS
jgi:hypothetical protein